MDITAEKQETYSHHKRRHGMDTPLHWRHNELDGVPNREPRDCLLNRLFWRRSKKTSKLRVTGLCVGTSPVTGEFPSQRASDAENVSIGWRHHAFRAAFPLSHHNAELSCFLVTLNKIELLVFWDAMALKGHQCKATVVPLWQCLYFQTLFTNIAYLQLGHGKVITHHVFWRISGCDYSSIQLKWSSQLPL